MLGEWIAKLIYSVVILGVLLALGSMVLGELHKVWLDKRLYFGKFRAFEKGVEKLRDAASRMIDGGAKYPEMHRIRAEVTDLLNIAVPAEQDLVADQRDWLRYSTQVDPELRERKVPTDELVLVAAARARPAIRVQTSKISEGGESWERILAPHANLTEAIARATGLVRRTGRMASSQTGFAIGEGLILTTMLRNPALAIE